MINPESVPDLPGVPVLDVDGDIIGSVERVYVHENTGVPLWVSIHMGFDGAPNAFAPLDGARFEDQPGSALHVGLPKAVLDGAPSITSVDTLTRDDVHTLRAYYSPLPAATAAAPSQAGSGISTVDVVRSEEQLRVSTVPVPKERVRFEKVIVTEEKTIHRHSPPGRTPHHPGTHRSGHRHGCARRSCVGSGSGHCAARRTHHHHHGGRPHGAGSRSRHPGHRRPTRDGHCPQGTRRPQHQHILTTVSFRSSFPRYPKANRARHCCRPDGPRRFP